MNTRPVTELSGPARARGLRAWAKGSYPHAAAAELIIRTGPKLLQGPWIVHDPDRGRYWFDTSHLAEQDGYLSGGERRVLHLAAALVDPDHPLDLATILAGLDRRHLALALATIAHAGGSHEHSEITWADDPTTGTRRPTGTRTLPSLYPWPHDDQDQPR